MRDNPNGDADEAMFNAAVYWEKAGRNDYALKVRKAFVKRFPDSSTQTYFNLANVYRKTCDYEATADRLERFATANPDEEALRPLDASVYREDLGDPKAALRDRLDYLKLATRPRARRSRGGRQGALKRQVDPGGARRNRRNAITTRSSATWSRPVIGWWRWGAPLRLGAPPRGVGATEAGSRGRYGGGSRSVG